MTFKRKNIQIESYADTWSEINILNWFEAVD